MEFETHIDFVLVAQIEGLFFQPSRRDGMQFTPNGDTGVRIILVPRYPDRDAFGHREGLTCKFYATYPATKEQALFADSYNRNVMLGVADGIDLPFQPNGEILIAEDGSCTEGFSPRRDLCPSDISSLIKRAESELAQHIDRFLNLLRWRQGIDAPGEVVKHRTLYWRIGGGEYLCAPSEVDEETVVLTMFGIQWDGERSTALQEIWSVKDMTEPLGHTLIREAANLVSESPRSAILMMTAALETAIKMHISHFAPDTAWLMREIASPPIFKILRDYIPAIHHAKGKEIDFWDKVKPFIKKVQTLVEVRNKIAHTGKIPEGSGPIQNDILLVTDMLYALDVLNGHEWAKARVSYEFCNALGWPYSNDGRGTITIASSYY
jgi:hypothetical protein